MMVGYCLPVFIFIISSVLGSVIPLSAVNASSKIDFSAPVEVAATTNRTASHDFDSGAVDGIEDKKVSFKQFFHPEKFCKSENKLTFGGKYSSELKYTVVSHLDYYEVHYKFHANKFSVLDKDPTIQFKTDYEIDPEMHIGSTDWECSFYSKDWKGFDTEKIEFSVTYGDDTVITFSGNCKGIDNCNVISLPTSPIVC